MNRRIINMAVEHPEWKSSDVEYLVNEYENNENIREFMDELFKVINNNDFDDEFFVTIFPLFEYQITENSFDATDIVSFIKNYYYDDSEYAVVYDPITNRMNITLNFRLEDPSCCEVEPIMKVVKFNKINKIKKVQLFDEVTFMNDYRKEIDKAIETVESF